jgi:hypothetical protein
MSGVDEFVASILAVREGLTLRLGTVASVTPEGLPEVLIGDSPVVLPKLKSYLPIVDEQVVVISSGNIHIVIGAVG